MAVMLGINPITWTNDDVPELGGDTPLEDCLSEARQAGFAGIELGGKFPRNATELKPILQRHGLALGYRSVDAPYRCCRRASLRFGTFSICRWRPGGVAARHVDRIAHVHCKDCRPEVLEMARRDELSFMAAVLAGVFTVPGDGFIDYSAILETLADAGYSGWLVGRPNRIRRRLTRSPMPAWDMPISSNSRRLPESSSPPDLFRWI